MFIHNTVLFLSSGLTGRKTRAGTVNKKPLADLAKKASTFFRETEGSQMKSRKIASNEKGKKAPQQATSARGRRSAAKLKKGEFLLTGAN